MNLGVEAGEKSGVERVWIMDHTLDRLWLEHVVSHIFYSRR